MVNSARDTALFGGSFDPPHLGHLEIIRRTLALPEVRRIVVVPAWLNPFKARSHAAPEKRLEWCRRVFDLPGVVVSDFEIRQQRPVYTVETYRALSREYPIGYLIVGADNLAELTKWHDFETLNRELTWIVAEREGTDIDTGMLRAAIPLPVSVPVSSTMIREGKGLEYVDERIRAEVEALYPPSENSSKKETL